MVITIPISYVRKLRIREEMSFSSGHTVNKCWTQIKSFTTISIGILDRHTFVELSWYVKNHSTSLHPFLLFSTSLFPWSHNTNLNLLVPPPQVAKYTKKTLSKWQELQRTFGGVMEATQVRCQKSPCRRVGSRKPLVISNTNVRPMLPIFWSWVELRNLKEWIST